MLDNRHHNHSFTFCDLIIVNFTKNSTARIKTDVCKSVAKMLMLKAKKNSRGAGRTG